MGHLAGWGITFGLSTLAIPEDDFTNTTSSEANQTMNEGQTLGKISNVISKTELETLKGDFRFQGYLKGDADQLFNDLTKGAKKIEDNTYSFSNGLIINQHDSSTPGFVGRKTIEIHYLNIVIKYRVDE